MENVNFKQKTLYFLKKYGYYLLVGFMTLSVALTLIIVGVIANKSEKDVVPSNASISPFLPVLNATMYKEYFDDTLVFNSTLKQWETHDGIDLQVASGSNVYSILDGEVIDVYTNVLEGTVVVVEHNGGLTSCYGSLDNDVEVVVGDSVSRGDILGTVSTSSTAELDAGAHLHFSMLDNGKSIDPAAYLNISSK